MSGTDVLIVLKGVLINLVYSRFNFISELTTEEEEQCALGKKIKIKLTLTQFRNKIESDGAPFSQCAKVRRA